jgi:hypothetical protein
VKHPGQTDQARSAPLLDTLFLFGLIVAFFTRYCGVEAAPPKPEGGLHDSGVIR